MRPIIKPALRRVWRDDRTLQLGLDPGRAVVLTGLDPPAARLIDLLDGTRDLPGALDAAVRDGLDPGLGRRVLTLLDDAAVLDDAAADPASLAGLGPTGRALLAPDLASLSLVRREPGAALATLARRRAASVVVRGAGRVGATVAALLGAAGVGRLALEDDAPARLADVCPAGVGAGDRGTPRASALRARLRRIAPSARTDPMPPGSPPDLVVLAPPDAQPPPEAMRPARAGDPPLLYVGVTETTAVVGPLVIAGTSACLHCLELLRADRDPAWPRIAAQLSGAGGREAAACDVALATLAASAAALQALALLDAGAPAAHHAPADGDSAPPATLGGTLELTLPDWRLRRRSWPAHPDCGCCPEA